jgi:HD-like signal output (HDOD) protein
MRKVLFVDDEPNILDGLKRMLRPYRDRWEMSFANGGEAALAEMANAKFDVIVSDMGMPGMDGAALLARVQEQSPATVRIILSGHTELEAVFRAVPIAHQFLTKPCDADKLRDVVERACHLQATLASDSIRTMVSRLDALPSQPRTHATLTRLLAEPDTALQDIAKVVETDVGISAKILQLVNSAFFGLPRRMTNIRDAVSFLGTKTLHDLVLTVEVFGSFEGDGSAFSGEDLQWHSLVTASIASKLLDDKRTAEDAFVAGLLHDVGKLILMMRLPDRLKAVTERYEASDLPMYLAEREVLGASHGEIGAYLLGIWGLPYPIVEAVACHHDPRSVPHRGWDALAAVHVANHLAHEVASPSAPPRRAGLDRAYLEELGVAGRLTEWREMAMVFVSTGS